VVSADDVEMDGGARPVDFREIVNLRFADDPDRLRRGGGGGGSESLEDDDGAWAGGGGGVCAQPIAAAAKVKTRMIVVRARPRIKYSFDGASRLVCISAHLPCGSIIFARARMYFCWKPTGL
jgi:hypothetical protein